MLLFFVLSQFSQFARPRFERSLKVRLQQLQLGRPSSATFGL